MEARLYSKAKEHILSGNIDLANNNIVVLLVDASYVPSFANDESRLSIPDSAIVAEDTLNTTSVANGVFDADDIIFSDVAGNTVVHIVLLQEAEIDAQAYLIAAYTNITPLVPDGSAITIQWDAGTNRIFAI